MPNELSCWQGVDISGAGIVGLCLAAISILFYAIALGTTHWAEGDNPNGGGVAMGLWLYCERLCVQYVDNEFLTRPSDLNLVTRTEASASFLLIAIFLNLCALVMISFSIGRIKHSTIVARAAACEFGSAFMGLMAMGIFADIISNLDGFEAGYSLALEVTAWLMNAVAGILLAIDSRSIAYLDATNAAKYGGAGMI